MSIDVALADANTLMLSALAEIIERDDRFSLMSTTSSAESFLQIALGVPCTTAVLDWNLPSTGAEKVLQTLRDHDSPTRVIVCTHSGLPEVAKRSMAAGAAGVFSHTDPTEKLLDAIIDVAQGKMVFPYLDVRELYDPLRALTTTEKAILLSLASGKTNKELSTEHGISINTVKFHLRNLYDKLAVSNRAQAIAFYYSTASESMTSMSEA